MEKISLKLFEFLNLEAEVNGLINQQTGEAISKGLLGEKLNMITKYWITDLNKKLTEQKESINKLRDELIQKYGDLVIYNDVDVLYLKIDKISFQSKEWITELKYFKYDIQFINYLYLEDRKKYIEQEESGQINTKGFRDENVKQNLLNIIKREIRRRKLENLGI